MRIAFQDRTVHERSRITLVSIADDILLRLVLFGRELPLESGKKPAAAASPQAGLLHRPDYLLGAHRHKHLGKCFVTVTCNVLIYDFGINGAAVSQRNPHLFFIKVRFLKAQDFFALPGLFVNLLVIRLAVQQVLLHQSRNILHLHPAVKNTLRVDDHDRSQLTKAETARTYDLHLALNPVPGYFLLQGIDDFIRIRGCASCTAAYHY
ncbi:hypothetical protein D3C80_1308830 [compost metagenome]